MTVVNIGEKIRKLRKEKGISQDTLRGNKIKWAGCREAISQKSWKCDFKMDKWCNLRHLPQYHKRIINKKQDHLRKDSPAFCMELQGLQNCIVAIVIIQIQ